LWEVLLKTAQDNKTADQEVKKINRTIDQVGCRQAAGVMRSGNKSAEVNVENLSEGITSWRLNLPTW